MGKLEEPEEQEEILKTSGLARIGSLRVSRPLCLSLSFEALSDNLTLASFILVVVQPPSICWEFMAEFGFSLTSPYCRLLFSFSFQPEVETKVKVDNCPLFQNPTTPTTNNRILSM